MIKAITKIINRKSTINAMDLILNKESWDIIKTKLRAKYPQLTDTDLEHAEGMESSMLRMVEYKLRKTKQQMWDIISYL